MKKSIVNTAIAAAILAGGSFAVNAAPLPLGSLMTVDLGNAGFVSECTVGSCFGMEVSPGSVVWTNIVSGTDGGLIIGKSQDSGGQELAPSATNTTPGEITDAWSFFSNFGTFYTPAGATDNYFDDTSCAGAGCIGVTQLGSWQVAWNGGSIPMGSAAGCSSVKSCTADQNAGIFITSWTVTPDPVIPDKATYELIYTSVVPNGDASGYGNVKFSLNMRGTIYTPVPAAVWLFGSGLVALAGIARRRKAVV